METKEFERKMRFFNNGFLHLFLNLAFLAAALYYTIGLGIKAGDDDVKIGLTVLMGSVCFVVWLFHLLGLTVIQPNEARVLTFFGKYSGTVKDNGYFWINPLYGKRRMTLRARNMDVPPIKVNDKNGNPIMIGLVLVWKIKDTYKACFDIDVESLAINQKAESSSSTQTLTGYDSFVNVQSDAALRNVAGIYAYDNMDGESTNITLRSGGDEVNECLERELRTHLEIAGIEVVEARINYLAYAAEIASVMLRRQQAEAIISAREKIVEGAVSMVELALNKLAADKVVDLDDERKAAMVSNLMVVLCSDENASPVLNTGSLYN